MEQSENKITVRGILCEGPGYSHENHGIKFFSFTLEAERLSGTIDRIPVIAPEKILRDLDLSGSPMVLVEGQVRSHNIHREDGRHLKIFIFASSVILQDGDPFNQVEITGNLCRDPVLRRTPLGRAICDVMLAVPRAFHRADYLPCILWGRTAQEAACCRTGDSIFISGRLQSRIYNKLTQNGAEQRTAYEISAMTADIPTDLY